MATTLPLRHELKFFISNWQYTLLRSALAATLHPDPNGDPVTNEYAIRSLYFDTAFDDALYDKLDGVQNRDKYRIRIYNFSDRVIKLECKTKIGTLISKRSLSIPRDLADQLIACVPDGLDSTRSGLLSDVYREMTTRLLHPVVIVDYVREAYLHPAEDVRITVDKQLRTGMYSVDLFNPNIPTIPPFDHDLMILEVKYNRVLPPYIRDILSTHCINPISSAISKYTWCRRFEEKEA